MKMSYVWGIIAGLDIWYVIGDASKGDFGFWFYFELVGALLSLWLSWDARKRELAEERAKKQFINIVINHMSNEPADVTAHRIAEINKKTGAW